MGNESINDNRASKAASLDEAAQIEQSLYELADSINDPGLAETIAQIIDAFENKKTALADLAYRDDTTGLFNNVYFTGRLLEEVSRGLRYNRDLSILVIELGEAFSENFSRAAAALSETLRRSDTCARIEGRVFAALLPETTSTQAEQVAEKLLLGIRPFSGQNTAEAWVGIADLTADRNNALKLESAAYTAKEAGKNRNVPVWTAAGKQRGAAADIAENG
jgi:diguanylate cyclase (GGDEF)-like protein